ncbi:MAG: MMPL family transporter [Galbitalea sp.]
MRETTHRGPLAALGAGVARHPVAALGAWAIVLAVVFVTAVSGLGGQSLFGRLVNAAPSVAGESSRGQALLSSGTTSTTYTLLLHDVDLDSSTLAALAGGLTARAAEIPGTRYLDPLAVPLQPDGSRQTALAPLFSTDGRGVLLSVAVSGPDGHAPSRHDEQRVRTILDTAATQARHDFPHATVAVGGGTLLVDSLLGQSESDLTRGETVALPIALIVMLVVFGGLIAAGLPLLGALASILGAFGALFVSSYLMKIDATVINVVTAVGLGLSIDYGLLMVSRFREEYRARTAGLELDTAGRRRARIEAIGATTASAGRTVAFSGTTFAIASLGLLVFDPSIVRAIGVASVSVTVIAILSALTLMPALLSLTGERLAWPGPAC